LSDALLDRIDDERAERSFLDLADFTRRTGAPTDALEALATAGAFGCFGQGRREALWAAGALRDARPDKLPGMVTGAEAPKLPGMHEVEEIAADLWATGLSAARHPTEMVREQLAARGIVTAEDLRSLPDRAVVDIAGVVTHRQQPSTAKGVIFLNLEDETGLVNVICTPDVWKRFRKVARTAPALEIRGLLEKYQGVTNVLARRIVALPLGLTDLLRSRDFH
jgi:error-prone DNA polymerase